MFLPLLFATLTPDLDALLNQPALSGATVSAYVSTLDGKVLYERNSSQRVVPASNQKLVSNAFALATLGTDFRPITSMWRRNTGVIVDAPGDPMLSRESLLQARRALGLVPGANVWVKQAYRPGVPPSWQFDDMPNRYAAQVTAFSIDRGGFELWGENGKAFLVPDAYGVRIETRPGKTLRVDFDPTQRRVRVTGPIPARRTRLDTLALPAPDEAAASALGGRLRDAEQLPDEVPDLTIVGRPLPEMLAACLKPSDNNIAEHLMLMAANKLRPIGQNPYGIAPDLVKDFLVKTVGADANDFRVFDGSGMSRHNLVTTRGIAKLLQWAAAQETEGIWRASLASPGSGTLANRLSGVAFEGKTGTLDMVASLSGYVRRPDGTVVVMSVILNNYLCPTAEARRILDAFATKIATADSIGTAIAQVQNHEGRRPHPHNSAPHVHRIRGFDHDGRFARARADRRDESGDASLHRAERVALRVR